MKKYILLLVIVFTHMPISAFNFQASDRFLTFMKGESELGASQATVIEAVDVYLQSGADPNAVDVWGTPLRWAIWAGWPQVVEKLVIAGARMDEYHHHMLPLHDAAAIGNVECIEILVRHGAQIDAPRKVSQSTSLHIAAIYGHVAAVQTLLALGASPHAKDVEGETPLDYANMARSSEEKTKHIQVRKQQIVVLLGQTG